MMPDTMAPMTYVGLVMVGALPSTTLLAMLSLPLLVRAIHDSDLGAMGQQRAIAKIDLETAQLHATFGVLLVIAAAIPEHPIHWTGSYVGILGFLGIISTGLCWWLWVNILDRVPAWEASLSELGTPVVAIASARRCNLESASPA